MMMKYTFLLLTFLLTGCSNPPPPPQQSGIPPLELPVNLALGKQVITLHAHITEAEVKKIWTVQMEFYPYPLRTWEEYRKNPPTPEQNAQLNKILRVISERPFDKGVPANFKVTIYDVGKKAIIISKKINYPETLNVGYGRYTDLVATKLAQGDYDITIEYTPYNADLASLTAKAVVLSVYNK